MQNTKYKTCHFAKIRPESLINQNIDENWEPILQPPPFPEYVSGHSVVSGSAATVLTSIFGDNFSFLDDTELPYGLPVRSFESFNKAAQEAARAWSGLEGMDLAKEVSVKAPYQWKEGTWDRVEGHRQDVGRCRRGPELPVGGLHRVRFDDRARSARRHRIRRRG